MKNISDERFVELAFQRANGESLSEEDAREFKEIQASPEMRQKFEAFVQTISETRGALGELIPGPEEASSPIDENTLAEYLDGALGEDERARVEERLAREPGALEQLISVASLLPEENEEVSAFAYVLALTKRGLRVLSHPSEGFSLVPLQAAAVLGSEQDVPAQIWTQDLGSMRVQCTMQRAAEEEVVLTIKLLDPEPVPRGTRVSLKSDGRVVQSELMPDNGEAILRGLKHSAYEVEIALPATTVASMSFDFLEQEE